MTNYAESLTILQEVNNLPQTEVKQRLDSMRLTQSDWAVITDRYLYTGQGIKNSMDPQDATLISYGEYMKMPPVIHGHLPFGFGTSLYFFEKRRREEAIAHHGSEEGVVTQKELQTLAEIRELWDEVRAKYNPREEIGKIFEDVWGTLRYGVPNSISLAEPLDDTRPVEKIKKCINDFKRATKYIEGSEITEELETTALAIMDKGVRLLGEHESLVELPIEEVIDKLGITTEEMAKWFEYEQEHKMGVILVEYGSIVSDKIESKEYIMTRLVQNKGGGNELSEEISRVRDKYLLCLDYPELYERTDDVGAGREPEEVQGSEEPKVEDHAGHTAEKHYSDEIMEDEYYDEDVHEEEETEPEDELIQMDAVELRSIIEQNNRTIKENEQKMKQALTDRILEQQRKIQQQEEEISKLRGQKEL